MSRASVAQWLTGARTPEQWTRERIEVLTGVPASGWQSERERKAKRQMARQAAEQARAQAESEALPFWRGVCASRAELADDRAAEACDEGLSTEEWQGIARELRLWAVQTPWSGTERC
jgi:hypothetical protein